MSNRRSTQTGHEREEAASVEKPLLTVKQAAEQLGIRKSRIYRMDRQKGPLRFTTRGRRIYVDQESVETYGFGTAPRVQQAATPGSEVIPAGHEGPEVANRKRAEITSEHSTQPVTRPAPLTSSGQRELIIRRPRLSGGFFAYWA